MPLNKENTEKIEHDNDFYCSVNHTCISCEYEKYITMKIHVLYA